MTRCRTSLDGQRADLGNVWTDTFHTCDPHRLSDYQLQVNLLRPVGSTDSPLVPMVGVAASKLPDDATVPIRPMGHARGRVLSVAPVLEKGGLAGTGCGTNGHLMVVAGFTDAGDGAHDLRPRPARERLGPTLRLHRVRHSPAQPPASEAADPDRTQLVTAGHATLEG